MAAGVEPMLVSNSNQLAGVDDVFNAVLMKGDMLGDVVFYGKGAGKLPTASAVVADVIDALKEGVKVHDSLFWKPAARTGTPTRGSCARPVWRRHCCPAWPVRAMWSLRTTARPPIWSMPPRLRILPLSRRKSKCWAARSRWP